MTKNNEIKQVVIWELIAELPEEEQAKIEKYLRDVYPDHFQETVMLIPADFKDRLPAVTKLLHKLIHSYKTEFKSYQKQFDLVNTIDKIVSRLEGYFHSTSYEENKPMTWDLVDLRNDLEFAVNIIDNMLNNKKGE